MKELVFLLEEPSAKAFLSTFLPRFVDDRITPRFIPFEGKNDLQKQMARRLRGYQNARARFIVIQDQDSHPDCVALKRLLVQKCIESGKQAVSTVRIACKELETFYLADLQAVELALSLTGLSHLQTKSKYRTPDALGSPSKELHALTHGLYQKVGGSREIGARIAIENSRSPSFAALVTAVKRYEAELLSLP